MRFIMPIICALLCHTAFAQVEHFDPSQMNPKIGVNLMKEFNKDSVTARSVPILIYMKEKADLKRAKDAKTRDGRIQFVYDALRKTAKNSQADLVDYLVSQKLSYKQYFVANMVAVKEATKAQVEAIAARKDVLRVVGNPKVHAIQKVRPITMDPFAFGAAQDNIKATGAETVWTELKNQGEGIVVAGQDTGVEWDHPALIKQYRGSTESTVTHDYNWHDAIKEGLDNGPNRCGFDLKAPCDDNDHGTHTIGTAVGSDGELNEIGMAPKAKWIACRNMDSGVGTPQTYIECFQFFLAPTKIGGDPFKDGKASMAPHIVNNSWGCTAEEGCEGGEFLDVLEALKAAGIMIVVSAGNDGPSCDTIKDGPAFHTDLALSVGAMNHKTGKIASFSSRGPSTFDSGIGPDISAPGENIRSSVAGKKYAQFMWSGTSMAGPHVVGAIALLWSLKPSLIGDIDGTTSLIRSSATPKTSTQKCGGVEGDKIPNNTFGYGALDVLKAAKTVL